MADLNSLEQSHYIGGYEIFVFHQAVNRIPSCIFIPFPYRIEERAENRFFNGLYRRAEYKIHPVLREAAQHLKLLFSLIRVKIAICKSEEDIAASVSVVGTESCECRACPLQDSPQLPCSKRKIRSDDDHDRTFFRG